MIDPGSTLRPGTETPEERAAKEQLPTQKQVSKTRAEEAERNAPAPKPSGGLFANLIKNVKKDRLLAELDRAIDEGDFEKAAEIKRRIEAN